MLRRFILMIVGLGLGVAACVLADLLLVQLPTMRGLTTGSFHLPQSFYLGGQPLLMAHMAAFGTLFALIRWWMQTDPLRRSRLSLWSMAVSCGVAAIVGALWHYPQPWLIMVAGTISASVQLASPWVSRADRLLPQRKTVV
jgi:hypothetical protein